MKIVVPVHDAIVEVASTVSPVRTAVRWNIRRVFDLQLKGLYHRGCVVGAGIFASSEQGNFTCNLHIFSTKDAVHGALKGCGHVHQCRNVYGHDHVVCPIVLMCVLEPHHGWMMALHKTTEDLPDLAGINSINPAQSKLMSNFAGNLCVLRRRLLSQRRV